MNTYKMDHFDVPGESRWSGKMLVPTIGDKVTVTINGFGLGTIVGYFIEHDWLGVYVKLDDPPSWWVEQQERRAEHPGRIAGCAMAFGAEIKEAK